MTAAIFQVVPWDIQHLVSTPQLHLVLASADIFDAATTIPDTIRHISGFTFPCVHSMTIPFFPIHFSNFSPILLCYEIILATRTEDSSLVRKTGICVHPSHIYFPIFTLLS